MKFSNLFSQFINTGTKPSSAKDASALLDETRSVILGITKKVESGEITTAGIDQIERASKAEKAKREAALTATEEAYRKQREQRLAIERRAASKTAASTMPKPKDRYGRTYGSESDFPPVAKPAAKPAAPAAPAASSYPTLQKLESISGPAASHFYRENERAIKAESAQRQHDRAQLEREMNQARASAKQLKTLRK